MYVLAIGHCCPPFSLIEVSILSSSSTRCRTSGTTAPGGPVPERWSWYHAAWMVVPSGTQCYPVSQERTPMIKHSGHHVLVGDVSIFGIWKDIYIYIYVYLHSAFNIRGMGLEVESRFPFHVRHKSFCLAGVTWNWRCSMLWILVGYVQEMCPRPCSNDFTCNARCSELSWRKYLSRHTHTHV